MCAFMSRQNGSICPGRFLGDSSVWLVIVSVTATFDICGFHDSSRREGPLEPKFHSGFIRQAHEARFVQPTILTHVADIRKYLTV